MFKDGWLLAVGSKQDKSILSPYFAWGKIPNWLSHRPNWKCEI